MTDGLVASFAGRVALVAVWAVLGLLGSIALTVVILLRKAPPLTTQVNQQTGVKEHGLGRWLLIFTSIGVGPPILVLVVMTVSEAIGWLTGNVPGWVWPVTVTLALTVLVTVLAVRARRHSTPPRMVTPKPPVAPPVLVPEPKPGWSLPAGVEQWDRRVQR